MATRRKPKGEGKGDEPVEDGNQSAGQQASLPDKGVHRQGFSGLKTLYWRDRSADISDVKAGYSLTDFFEDRTIFLVVFLIPGLLYAAYRAWDITLSDVLEVYAHVKFGVAELSIYAILILTMLLVFYLRQRRGVYLVDFEVFTPPDRLKVQSDWFVKRTRSCGYFNEESIKFHERLLPRGGLGEETYFPEGVRIADPPKLDMEAAREEADMVFTGLITELLDRTGLTPRDIDILVVNCSLFVPTPSLSAMIVNKFKMRSNVRTYNLGGMGCSAGVIAVDLARDLLQVHAGCRALVVSTENITQNWYHGNDRSMMIQNTIFRLGGAAVLLSNRYGDSWKANYQLLHTVRVHKGMNDDAYNAVYQKEDDDGKKGVALFKAKDLLKVVGDALKTNFTVLGPLVLPYTEQVKFFSNFVARKFLGFKWKPYVPDFRKAFDHFCIHAAGRAVIDGLQENLSLSDTDTAPSRATLQRWGNVSSASIWYELDYIERFGERAVKRGDRVWQITFGSGFKCNSAVWKALRAVRRTTKGK